jgi:hypothetical protein
MSLAAKTIISAQPGPQTAFLQTAADICILRRRRGRRKDAPLDFGDQRRVGGLKHRLLHKGPGTGVRFAPTIPG